MLFELKNVALYKVIFTFSIVLFPVLSLYSVGLGSVTLGDLLLIFSVIYSSKEILLRKKVYKFNVAVLLFLIYIIIQCCFTSAFSLMSNEVILRTARYAFYLFVLFFCVPDLFVTKLGNKLFVYVSLFAVAFIVFQSSYLYLTGRYIPGYLPFLPIMRTELVEFSTNFGLDGGDVRPRSIFGEPAHFSQYVLGALAIVLFFGKGKFKILIGLLITVGIFLSLSSTGILGCFLIWIIFMFALFIGKSSKTKILVIGSLCLAFIVLDQLPLYNQFVERFTMSGSTSGRTQVYLNLMDMLSNLKPLQFFFGHGMDKNEILFYLPGFVNVFWYFGLIGEIIFIIVLLTCLSTTLNSNLLLLIFVFLNLGTEVALGPFIVLYMSLIVSNIRTKKRL